MTQNIRSEGFGPYTGILQQVDPYHNASRVSIRPMDASAGGHYRFSARSGVLTGAAIVAGAPLFSMRWSDPNTLCLLTYLRAFLVPTAVFTAAQELGLDLIHVTGFTVSDSTGAVVPPIPMRKSMESSVVTDMRIAAATLLTAGTRTLDPGTIHDGGGLVNVVNAAAATAYVNPNSGGTPQFGFDYEAQMTRGEMPLTMGKDEGFLIRNTVIFPGAGTATLIVNGVWIEIPKISQIIPAT